MAEADPMLVALRFNDRINARDLEGLCALMTQDHAFVDSAGERVEGLERAREAWRGFFKSFPDYRNVLHSVELHDGHVIIAGRSSCSNEDLDGAALWTAAVQGERVAEWRVYHDDAENRLQLGVRLDEP